jgi:hypothetical protein
MENAEAQIRQRFFRKTIAHPEGAVAHHGDCDFSSVKICTCALLHDLAPIPEDRRTELYPSFDLEQSEYEKVREKLMHRKGRVKKH